MALVVTGLSQTADVSAVRTALTSAGLPVDELQVITADDSAGQISSGLAGADIMTSDGGSAIPGINSGGRHASGFFRNESLSDRLGDFEIPDSEVENYIEALERGRAFVAFFAKTETVDNVEAAFRSSGLANVRRF